LPQSNPKSLLDNVTTIFDYAGFAVDLVVTVLGSELAGDENHPVRNDSMVVSSLMPDCRWLHFNATDGAIGQSVR